MSPLDSVKQTLANPFAALVGKPLEENPVDIEDINLEAFRACERLVKDVAAGGGSASLMVFGDTGSGKTHLIGRVRRWLESQPANLFVFVRLETSPVGIWRHVRRQLASALLGGGNNLYALDRLLGHRLKDLESLDNRDLSVVLEKLLNGEQLRDSAAWLRGEGLPEGALQKLGLSAPGSDEEPEVVARQVVMALSKLIQPGAVVFCFDQLEAIRSAPGDKDGPHAFGRMAACLIDETGNAALISCQQSSFINELEQILEGAVRSRVMARRTPIKPLSWEQAKRLIEARLARVPELTEERGRRGGCWPLDESQIKTVLDEGGTAAARRIIARSKDLFDNWTNEPEAQEPLPQFLRRMLDDRYKAKAAGETEAVLRNGIPLLARSAGLKCSPEGERSPFAFRLEDGRTTVAICNEAHGNSLTSHLKRISEAWKREPNRSLVMLRDARMPVGLRAKVAVDKIAELTSQGGRWTTVSQEAVEALAALRRLLSDAVSDDLAYRGEAVSGRSVEDWIAGNLPVALDPLVSELRAAAEEISERNVGAELAELLAEHKMVRVDEAARRLEVSAGELEECARRDAQQFGFLGGSIPAFFQPVAAAQPQRQ